ncbi:MAG: hypothetical protein HYV09_23135 [Deltaproteobacteria bacterium]|nr:hypothetical protein [Deltaproteobacteria bacterium]
MRSRPITQLVIAATLAIAAAAGCTPSPKGPQGPTRPIASWAGDEAKLLDDGIDVGAVPLGDAAPARDEASEELVPQRIEASDGVVVAKVIAVSAEPLSDKRKRFRVELSVTETLAGKAPGATLELEIAPNGPAFGTVRALDARLIGRRLVVFYRRYVSEDGEAITHFHLSPPTKEMLEAVGLHKAKSQFD